MKKGVKNSDHLGESLIDCPYHLATVSGYACMLDPDNYGARIAFVDYDGKQVFDSYKQNPPKTHSDEIDFAKQNASHMMKSPDALREWAKWISQDE